MNTSIMWVTVRTPKLLNTTFEQKIERTYENGKLVSEKPYDEVRIQVGNNYGNQIFTNKAGANKVYNIIKNDEKFDYGKNESTFKLIKIIKSILAE